MRSEHRPTAVPPDELPRPVRFSLRQALAGVTIFCVLLGIAGLAVLWVFGIIGSGLLIIMMALIPQTLLLLTLKSLIERFGKP